MSRTINMTAEDDNGIVWLIKISRAGTEWKFATEDITLSSNLWDGKALAINDNRFSMNEIGKRINIPSGGTIGEISTVTFSFVRYGSNTFINNFFNEFYPATSGLVLVAMDVEVGMLWDSSTSEDDITWLYKYNINEYAYSDNRIDLVCSEFSDFEFSNLPYYRVQTEYDNGISYYPDASNEAVGKNLPIIYGRADNNNIVPWVWGCSPVVRVSKNKFIIATHECYNAYTGTVETVNKYMFEEIAEY